MDFSTRSLHAAQKPEVDVRFTGSPRRVSIVRPPGLIRRQTSLSNASDGTKAGAGSTLARLCRRACLLIVAWALLVPGAIAAPEDPASGQALDPIDALLASQAWRLALRAIDSAQRDAIAPQWQDLERRRLVAYRNLTDVASLAERVARLPPETPAEFRRWALEQLLDTSLAAHDLPSARAALEQLVADSDAATTKPLRLRLVRAYVDADRVTDALAVFTPLIEDKDARALHAELLLRSGHEREAFERVAGLKSPESRLWRLIAAKRLALYAPADVVRELTLLVREFKDRPGLQRVAWLARADAAGEIGQLARRVNSLEQAFRIDPKPAAGLFRTTPDDLWSAYFALARHVAQKEKLSLGPLAIAQADEYRKSAPYTARALYAWDATEASGAEVRAVAHERLVASLSAHRLDAVTRALYTLASRVVFADLPDGVRRALMNEALARRDLPAAAGFARELDTPPADVAARDWALRRARLLLYGGDTEAAVKLLGELIAEDDFDDEFAHRYLQVVFDLQGMGKHREALALLDSVYSRVDNARMHRELLYWEAESAAALKRFADAAELYLRSARFDGDDGSDRWGQSARFRAADVLAKGGMTKDAEAVYRGLLKETPDPDQRVRIEQNIERLWLPAPTSTTP